MKLKKLLELKFEECRRGFNPNDKQKENNAGRSKDFP